MIEAVTIGTRTLGWRCGSRNTSRRCLLRLQPGLQATLQPFVTQSDKTLIARCSAIGGKGLSLRSWNKRC